jgi:hypothetical protein
MRTHFDTNPSRPKDTDIFKPSYTPTTLCGRSAAQEYTTTHSHLVTCAVCRAKQRELKTHVVVTTDYATGRILAVYGPFTRVEAENLRMALPASTTNDHDAVEINPVPEITRRNS